MDSPQGSDDDWLATGRVHRAVTPARLALQAAAAAARARSRALRGGDVLQELASDKRLHAATLKVATRLGEMKGAAMKLGQILSVVDVGLLPEAYRDALAALQADAPPMPFELVRDVVTEELGAPPEKIFTWFSPAPMAAASIGQVHMAHLGDTELVVKVQYPGIAKAVEADLRNAALLSLLARLSQKLLAGLVGDIDTRALIDEVRDRIGEELDYRIEAANQQAFADLWRGDPCIGIPEVIHEFSTRRVLTTEYVDAMRWKAALASPQQQRDRWAEVIARFVETSLFRNGLVNLDPHPGNYLFHEDGRVTFLDFGCAKRLTPDQVKALRAVAFAMFKGDDDDIIDTMVAAGFLHGTDFDREVLLAPIRQSMEPVLGPQPFRFSREYIADQLAVAFKQRLGREEMRFLRKVDVPAWYVMLGRVSAGLNGILFQFEAAVDFRSLIDQLFGDDPDYPGLAA
jgi:predicted unusual protein kinase regulating ubiquinone biosynthesis (AarF/ABC1/UbiB family)